jgi:hypothetical protein
MNTAKQAGFKQKGSREELNKKLIFPRPILYSNLFLNICSESHTINHLNLLILSGQPTISDHAMMKSCIKKKMKYLHANIKQVVSCVDQRRLGFFFLNQNMWLKKHKKGCMNR